MRTSIPGNKARRGRPDSQEGSILVDAIVGIMLVSTLGVAIMFSLGQTYKSLDWLEKGLAEAVRGLGQAYSQLW